MTDLPVQAIRERLRASNYEGPYRSRVTEDRLWTLVEEVGSDHAAIARCADDDEAELIVLLRNNAESLLDALERAQAASEGVDMLVAQAERRGAVKALEDVRAEMYEHCANTWEVDEALERLARTS